MPDHADDGAGSSPPVAPREEQVPPGAPAFGSPETSVATKSGPSAGDVLRRRADPPANEDLDAETRRTLEVVAERWPLIQGYARQVYRTDPHAAADLASTALLRWLTHINKHRYLDLSRTEAETRTYLRQLVGWTASDERRGRARRVVEHPLDDVHREFADPAPGVETTALSAIATGELDAWLAARLGLSDGLRKALGLVLRGMSNAEISEALETNEATVRKHRERIHRRIMKAAGLTEAEVAAVKALRVRGDRDRSASPDDQALFREAQRKVEKFFDGREREGGVGDER